MEIPETHLDLLEGNSLAHISTVSGNGIPHSSPVWIGKGENLETVVFVTSKGTQKYKNLMKTKRVAASLVDPKNPFRGLMLQGKIDDIEANPDEVFSILNSLSQSYTGNDYVNKPDPTMVAFKILVTKAHSF